MTKYEMLRKEKGLTQVELAKALHVTQTTVSKWECEKATPDIATLEVIAKYFDVSIDFLLGRNTPTNLSENENTVTLYGRGVGKRTYRLSDQKLSAIKALLDADIKSDNIDF